MVYLVRREADGVEEAQRVDAVAPYQAVLMVARGANLRDGQKRNYRVAVAGWGKEAASGWATVTVVAEVRVEIRVVEDGQDVGEALFGGGNGGKRA